MTSLGLRTTATTATPAAPGEEAGRSFAQEAHLNAVRLARFDIVLTAPGLALAGFLVLLAWWVELRPLAPVFLPLLVAGVRTWRAVRDWNRMRRSDPAAAIERDALEQAQARALREDLEQHLAATTPVGTYLLVIALVTVAVMEVFTGGARHATFAAGLVKTAARAGEWWRLITGPFLHADIGHLIMNAAVLIALGRMIEAYDRPLRLPLVYLASGLAGSVGSMLMLVNPSIGSSGAILGLAGYVLVVAGRAFGVPGLFRKKMLALLGSTALIGAAAFFRIDNGAHLGGVIGGAVVGLLTLPERRLAAASGQSVAGQRDLVTRWSGVLDRAGWLAWAALLSGALFTVLRLWSIE
jgi:rhomboid protease GluP